MSTVKTVIFQVCQRVLTTSAPFARLKKRGLSWEKFQQLARGKLAIVPLEIAW